MAGIMEARLRELKIERHTRMAVGVSALPYDVAVEVEAVFEVQ